MNFDIILKSLFIFNAKLNIYKLEKVSVVQFSDKCEHELHISFLGLV
jgi:hypothetical protein